MSPHLTIDRRRRAERGGEFALTGGLGSGKSTVLARFVARGLPVVNADELARSVVEPGQPALAELARVFGPDVLDARGALDRRRLAERAFADPNARKALEAITHPRIAAIRLRHNVAGRHIVVKRNADRGMILVDNTPTPTT